MAKKKKGSEIGRSARYCRRKNYEKNVIKPALSNIRAEKSDLGRKITLIDRLYKELNDKNSDDGMFSKTGRKNCWQLAYPETAKELVDLRSEAGEKLEHKAEAKAEVEFEREYFRIQARAQAEKAELDQMKCLLKAPDNERASIMQSFTHGKTKQAEASSTKQAEVDQMKCLLKAPNDERASIMQSVTREKTKHVEIEGKTKQMRYISKAPNDKRATIMQALSNNHKEVSAPKKPRLVKRAKGFLKPLARLLPSRSLEEGEVSSLVSEGATADRYDFHNSHALVKVAFRGISPRKIDDCLVYGKDIGQENKESRYPDTTRVTDGTTVLCVTKESLNDDSKTICIRSGWKKKNDDFLPEDIPAPDDEEGRIFLAKGAKIAVKYISDLEKQNQRLRDDNERLRSRDHWFQQEDRRLRDDNHWFQGNIEHLENELANRDSEIRRLRNYGKAYPDNREREYYSNTPPRKRQMDECPHTCIVKLHYSNHEIVFDNPNSSYRPWR